MFVRPSDERGVLIGPMEGPEATPEWGTTISTSTMDDAAVLDELAEQYVSASWRRGEPFTTQPLLTSNEWLDADGRPVAAYGYYGPSGNLDAMLALSMADTGQAVGATLYYRPGIDVTQENVLDALRLEAQAQGVLDHPPTPAQVDATIEADSDRGPEPSIFSSHDAWVSHRERLNEVDMVNQPGLHRLAVPDYYVDASSERIAYNTIDGLLAYGYYDFNGDLIATYFVDFRNNRAISAVMWTDGDAFSDACDFDDDNDGILDRDEMPDFLAVVDGNLREHPDILDDANVAVALEDAAHRVLDRARTSVDVMFAAYDREAHVLERKPDET